MISKIIVLLVLSAALAACQSPQKSTQSSVAMDSAIAEYQVPKLDKSQELSALPEAVSQALLPDAAGSDNTLFGQSKYDINAQQINAVTFFAGLVKDTPYSVAVHPDVTGTISLDMKQVALDEVFALVSEMYGYQIERKQNIYRIYPAGLRTETFAVNYLLMKRDGITQTSITSGGVSQQQGNNSSSSQNNFSGNSSGNNNSSNNSNNLNGSNNANGTNISTRTETDFWTELLTTLKSMIGLAEGKTVTVTPQAGLVTVRAMPDEIRAIKHFLQISEEIIQRQVILEARIIEVSLSDGYQQGINWRQILANVGSTEFQYSTSSGSIGDNISAALGNITSLSFVNKDFSGVLSLLATQGNVQVLSSPRVTAVNNQKAVIKVGDDEYFVTDVSSQSTISASITSVVPNIELTPFFSGIALDVTPQIDKDGVVLLHVHPSVIET
jgi:MSHA biogenesis protein MshL